MVNAWTWGLLAGTAVAAALTFVLALALRRRPRAVGLGVLLVPVTALWLWAFGITADTQQTGTTRTFTGPVAVGDLPGRIFGALAGMHLAWGTPTTLALPSERILAIYPAGNTSIVTTVTSSPAVAFWQGMCILGVAALFAVVVSRQAGYLAGAGLFAFGLYQLIAVAVFNPPTSGTAWYDWLYGMTSRGPVCAVAVGSVVAGLVLVRYTVVSDMLKRMTLASRVEVLTQSRAEAVGRRRGRAAPP